MTIMEVPAGENPASNSFTAPAIPLGETVFLTFEAQPPHFLLDVQVDAVSAASPAAGLGSLAVEAPVTEPEPVYVEVAGGKQLQFVSFFDGDPRYGELVQKIDAGQKREYIKEGVWKPDAEGHFVHGDNVEIMALLDEQGEPVVSYRKVHADTDEAVGHLPSIVKGEEAEVFTAARSDFDAVREGRPVVEIAGLWKNSAYHADAKLALFRLGFQQSAARGELWFMGVVGTVYRDLNNTYGEGVVHTISKPFSVQDADANAKTRLRLVYMDPATYFDDMITQIDRERHDGQTDAAYLHDMMLWYTLDGWDRSTLSEDTVDRLQRVASHGYSS